MGEATVLKTILLDFYISRKISNFKQYEYQVVWGQFFRFWQKATMMVALEGAVTRTCVQLV